MSLPRAVHPRTWGFHLLALVLTGTAVVLGLWQYDAWQARRAAERIDLTHAAPIPLTEAMGPDDPFPGNRVGQPVTVSGTWLPEGSFAVSERENGGFWAVSPMLTPNGSAIEVVRGWVPTLDALPDPPEGAAKVTGQLQPSEGTGVTDPDGSDRVLPQLRIADAIQWVEVDLYGGYVVQAPPEAGLVQADLSALPKSGRFTALRNLFYAFEWWFFAAFAAFIWWRWLQEDVLPDGPRGNGPPDDAEGDDS